MPTGESFECRAYRSCHWWRWSIVEQKLLQKLTEEWELRRSGRKITVSTWKVGLALSERNLDPQCTSWEIVPSRWNVDCCQNEMILLVRITRSVFWNGEITSLEYSWHDLCIVYWRFIYVLLQKQETWNWMCSQIRNETTSLLHWHLLVFTFSSSASVMTPAITQCHLSAFRHSCHTEFTNVACA